MYVCVCDLNNPCFPGRRPTPVRNRTGSDPTHARAHFRTCSAHFTKFYSYHYYYYNCYLLLL